jgi:hypothetical protein
MAKNEQNSHFSFVRIFILLKNMLLRSSPLLKATKLNPQKKPGLKIDSRLSHNNS